MRKVIQISMSANADVHGTARYLVALCDDGSMWFKWEATDSKAPWKPIDPIPQSTGA